MLTFQLMMDHRRGAKEHRSAAEPLSRMLCILVVVLVPRMKFYAGHLHSQRLGVLRPEGLLAPSTMLGMKSSSGRLAILDSYEQGKPTSSSRLGLGFERRLITSSWFETVRGCSLPGTSVGPAACERLRTSSDRGRGIEPRSNRLYEGGTRRVR